MGFVNYLREDFILMALLCSKELSKGTEIASGGASLSDQLVPYAPMGPSKMMFTKPVIAAINGYAVAGGMELAMMCDMRVADESTTFGIFCRRFGVPLVDGGTVRLPALIGLSRAMDLILTGRPITAVEAEKYGLVNRIVPDGRALEYAIELAKQISEFPQECMLADRRSAYHSTYSSPSLDEALQYEHENGKSVIFSESVFGAKRFAADKVGKSGSFEEFKPK
ncbi:putative enoyl-CoA hydratase, mitochondrial-like [Apostichopus japonicus]|uniref:Putative enoyl-CoA hydratase, mitochondrial-like n=1 Tax=Stichopus japonicus TaxID=307972 RepID=A0A2G8KAD2_STIJA|nr:putative enoyl-CoA hydratase, mitochondrial-like [Apostichopus japonicus]